MAISFALAVWIDNIHTYVRSFVPRRFVLAVVERKTDSQSVSRWGRQTHVHTSFYVRFPDPLLRSTEGGLRCHRGIIADRPDRLH